MVKKIIYVVLTIFLLFCTFTVGYFYRDYEVENEEKVAIQETPVFSEDILMIKVNEWRLKNNLKQFGADTALCKLTEQRLSEIKINFSHRGFGDLDRSKLPFNGMAENLSRDYQTEAQTLRAWLNSPTHAANLKADYQYSCIRCSGNVCVQMFANY